MSWRLYKARLPLGIGLVVVASMIAFLLLRGGDSSSNGGDDSGSKLEATNGPEAASLERLHELAGSIGHPVYWAGQQPGRKYELTVESDGNILIRYLPESVPVGSRQIVSLTIGTYPFIDAFGALEALAGEPGAVRDETPDGGLVVTNETNPNSVYVAFPDTDYQIEVYDPDPERALEIATSGAIEAIE